MTNDPNITLANYVYENAEMGKQTIPKVMEIVTNDEMKQDLTNQMEEYNTLASEAKGIVTAGSADLKEPGTVSNVMSDVMLKMKTLTDKSSSNLAEMMIQGSVMGTITLQRHLNRAGEKVDSRVKGLADKMMQTEKNNIEQLKKYL